MRYVLVGFLCLLGLGLDGLDLAGLGVFDLAVLAGLQDRDFVGVDLHAALPGAVFGAVAVVLKVADDTEEGAFGDGLLFGPLASGPNEDVEELGLLALGVVLLGEVTVGGEGEAHLGGLAGGLLVDVDDVADDFAVVVVVFLLSHNCKVLIVNGLC